jgi:hypothetical protein
LFLGPLIKLLLSRAHGARSPEPGSTVAARNPSAERQWMFFYFTLSCLLSPILSSLILVAAQGLTGCGHNQSSEHDQFFMVMVVLSPVSVLAPQALGKIRKQVL